MSGLRFFDSAAGEDRARHAGVEHRVSPRLEPGAKQCDVSGAADTVSTFYDDQLAAVFFLFNAGERRAVRVFRINKLCPAFSC